LNKEDKLLDFFKNLEDPRREKCKKHLLLDIVAISVCGVICGADSWNEIEDYGKIKYDWLKTFLVLPYGIPSHDTFNRVFCNLCPEKFEVCFGNWVASISNLLEGEVVAFDGKTIRGAKVNGVSPIHMVSAWACESNLVLGQQKVGDKTNEITAIPNLIEALALEGTTVTIDAMGCQTEIAQKIIDAQANYVLAVKANQPELLENIEDEFRFNKKINTSVDVDYGHGRIETRTCSVISDFIHIEHPQRWESLTSVVRIESLREFKATGKKESAIRYYITSLNDDPEELQQVVRNHWAIENKLHWSLDVSFNEDHNRKRKGNASQNFSLINKIALNLAKQEKTCKLGIKSKRKKAGWDNNYLETLLKI
jgi:predicted transposase YbfD/YdcC